MSAPSAISRSDLIDAIENSPASEASKRRAMTALKSTLSQSFTLSSNSKRWILQLYARRLARDRPVRVEGEETFLADIAMVSTDLLFVPSIARGALITSIWMDGESRKMVSALTAISHNGWLADPVEGDASSPRTIARPNEVIRLFGPTDVVLPGEPGQLAVEWAGLVGHPSSYGLLGGFVLGGARPATVALVDPGDVDFDSLARSDFVAFELLEDYRLGIESLPLRITVAAHGHASSSRMTFKWLGRMLAETGGEGWPDDEAVIWEMWDRVRADDIRRPQ